MLLKNWLALSIGHIRVLTQLKFYENLIVKLNLITRHEKGFTFVIVIFLNYYTITVSAIYIVRTFILRKGCIISLK